MPSMIFEDSDIKIDPGCAILVTTESLQTESKHLPDNLKVLFRPVAMANPVFSLIAELVLCSQGFDEARVLAKKLAGWIIRTQKIMYSIRGHTIFNRHGEGQSAIVYFAPHKFVQKWRCK